MSKIYFFGDSEKYSEFSNDHVAPFTDNSNSVYRDFKSIDDFMNRRREEYDDEDHAEVRHGTVGTAKDRYEKYQLNQDIRFENDLLIFLEQAIALKFDQNPALKKLLLETGDAKLIYNHKHNSFLGIGKHESGPCAGKNHLGRLLMEYREIKKYE